MTGKTLNVGETGDYQILIVNPTNKLKVYKVIPETSDGLQVSVSESVVAIPAGSSKTITVSAKAMSEGAYNFGVNVFDGNALLNKVALTANVQGSKTAVSSSNPVVVLTIVLAIIFIVLLVVLIALLGRKPEKSEEFGESYY